MRLKVLVHHPGRQHAHQLVCALQEGNLLEKFITSVWFKPNKFPYALINLFPSKLKKLVKKELEKRYYEDVDGNFVEQFPFFEILREGLDRLLKGYKNELGVYMGNQIHDWYVAKQMDEYKPDVIVGYEASSLRSFKRAKDLNVVTVLDLAQVHYKFLDEVRRKYLEYDKTFDNKISGKVNRVKEEELKCADYIITLSEFVKGTLTSHGISENKIYLANLGFAPEKFRLKETYRRDGTFKILYVGAIIKRKGIRILLEAYSRSNLKNSELILIGGMTKENHFLKEYEGMYKHIPYLSHEQLVSYYQDADLFVFPSYLDSWGMVVIEAMACGTPVVVSENTGSKEVVVNGMNGFIVPVEDVEALKEKILFFYNNRRKLEYFGRNSRRQVEKYTWTNYRKRIKEIILEIWERRKYEGCPDSERP
jgi:starch synthase